MTRALEEALTRCAECGRPFAQPVTEARARAEWGDAADDEIGYACGACAEAHGFAEPDRDDGHTVAHG